MYLVQNQQAKIKLKMSCKKNIFRKCLILFSSKTVPILSLYKTVTFFFLKQDLYSEKKGNKGTWRESRRLICTF